MTEFCGFTFVLRIETDDRNLSIALTVGPGVSDTEFLSENPGF